MIVDDRGDTSHEGQSCRHVEVKMERLAEPATSHRGGKILESKPKITDTNVNVSSAQPSEKPSEVVGRWRALLFTSVTITHPPPVCRNG